MPKQKTALQSGSNGTVEVFRLIGAIGIVWFHAQAPGHTLAYAGLPMFITFVVLLPSARGALLEFTHNRARRLLRPWLVWSAFYASVDVLIAYRHGLPVGRLFKWNMLLTGTSTHLWFLPFAFVCGIVFFLLEPAAGELSYIRFLATLLVSALTIPAWTLLSPLHLPTPLGQWLFGLASASYGFVLRLVRGSPGRIGAVMISVIVAIGLSAAVGHAYDALADGLGIGLAFVGASIWMPSRHWMTALRPISFVIYLVHPFVLSLVGYFIGFSRPSLLAVLTVVVTFCVGVMIQKSPWQRVFL